MQTRRPYRAGAADGIRAKYFQVSVSPDEEAKIRRRAALARPLLTVEEVRRLPDDEALVFCPGHAPIRARRLPYFRDPVLAGRAAVPPPPASGRLDRDWAGWTAWKALPPPPGLLAPPPPLPTARDLDKIGS
jgi:Type IV secretory system Conjugative DNA transfer